jgi:hypothetical protein
MDNDNDDIDDDFATETETVVWLEEEVNMNNANVSALERTIIAMEESHVCVHPGHYHSFQQVNFMMPLGKCAGCDQGLPTILFGGGNDASKHVVRCVACGAVAHRRCFLSKDLHWSVTCPVNARHIHNENNNVPAVSSGEPVQGTGAGTGTGTVQGEGEGEHKHKGAQEDADCLEESWSTSEHANAGNEVDRHTAAAIHTRDDQESVDNDCDDLGDSDEFIETSEDDQSTHAFEEDELIPLPTLWTQEGPPQHWASNSNHPQSSLSLSLPTITFPASNVVQDDQGDGSTCSDEHVHVTPLHYANHPFASVSRALQENVIAHFRRQEATTVTVTDSTKSYSAPDDKQKQKHESTSIQTDIAKVLEPVVHVEPEQEENPIFKFASGTYEAVKTSVNMPRRIGAVAVAGGIAGGVAGLVIAGPAGAFCGYKLGQTAGALGVILEGSVSIGVFVASVATAGYTAQQIQEQIQERRILTMGEDGSPKLLLVRPNIQIDPVWDQICTDARRNAPKEPPAFTLYPGSDAAKKRERYRRDSDIVRAAEDEIPTTEKVLLLVSRMLNDKSSLPGHIYRYLIEAFKDRCKERECLVAKNTSIQAISPRARRDDAHAVIKHVTAALLEVRPGFAASPAITELTATAVESLVFGQLYSLVFDEIAAETKEHDTALREKIETFEQERSKHDADNLVSDRALDALRLLPEGHSAVDKLVYCVRFLELISDHFSSATDSAVCADSLLKMACQHILAAKLDCMNAQIAFLEEFARDAQLLRGREGYALVTLQASLHFLNMSRDMEKDIFGQDDDEENVPVVAS